MTGNSTSLSDRNYAHMINEYKFNPKDMKKALEPFVGVT